MLEPRQGPRFGGEPTLVLDLPQHLHCDVAFEAHVPAPVHVGHASAIDQLVDAVSGLEDGMGGDHRTPWDLPCGPAA
jgi:hypothetical protein